MTVNQDARRRSWVGVLSDWLFCAAFWSALLLYAWNHRVFLSQTAKFF